MRRLAALAALAAVVGSGCSSGPTEAPKTPAPTPKPVAAAPAQSAAPVEESAKGKASSHVARTLAYVSELRKLAATKPVPGERLSRQELVARVRDKAMREYPAEVLKREGLVLQLMDFAPPGFDYLAETLKLLEQQLEGFYEPKDGTMYIASDLKGMEAEATLAHELVHALQDQHWDLKSRSDYKPGKSDETLALAALAEGDATSLMMDFVLADQHQTAIDVPDEMMRQLMQSSMQIGNIQSVPHILRASLVSPYVEGLAFVNARRRREHWKGVDAAWKDLPKTTEQVLHPDKWEKREPGIPIATPTAKALGAGFVMDEEDTAGELGYALMFGEWMEPGDARMAAAGWGGDRSIVVSRGDELAGADHLRYDEAPAPTTDAFAERAFSKIAKGLGKRYGKPTTHDKTFTCFERPTTGPLAVLRRGRDLVVIAGPAKVSGSTWSPTGTCALAKTWADEVASSAKP